jgi:hypothetical protein
VDVEMLYTGRVDNEPTVTSSFHPVEAWPPRTEAALEAAAKDQHLVETNVLELKRELPPGSDSANKELARDLASLAIDGGLLIIGVDEAQNYALTPVPLGGLAERVELVAASRIDEPLKLAGFIEIESVSTPGDGYLLVRIPASPRAPHMVDNRYWGRGHKTKHMLSDAQVERLIARRARWAVNAEEALNGWMAQDPINPAKQVNGHLFVVAEPMPPRERMLLETMTATGDFTAVFRDLVGRTKHNGASFVPDMPSHLSNFSTTADGWAWNSYALFGDHEEGQPSDRESRALMVEICENGRLRLFCGRAAEQLGTTGYRAGFVLFDDICLGLTARMVSLASGVSQAAGYLGSWDFGVGVTGIKGAKSYSRFERKEFAGPSYTADKYTLTTRASLADIEAGSGPVIERLFGRLIRAIGADQIEANKKHFA